jgi:hypothetical protein
LCDTDKNFVSLRKHLEQQQYPGVFFFFLAFPALFGLPRKKGIWRPPFALSSVFGLPVHPFPRFPPCSPVSSFSSPSILH